MAREFDRKLRLTAAAIGCGTCKELVAAFRRINPATPFDTGRAYKWLQGRALPRQRQVYDDWASLLDLGWPAAWLLDCDTDTFLELLGTRHGLDRDTLVRRAESFGGPASGVAVPSVGGDRYLCGTYLAYSHAWSPYYRGRLIRGTLSVTAPLARGRLAAAYTEALPTGPFSVQGPVVALGRSLYLHLREPGSEVPLFMTLFQPAPPASVLAGFLCGATFVGQDQRPSATRVLAARLPETAEPARGTNRYLEPGESVAADLQAAGLALGAPAEVDARIASFLDGSPAGGLDQIDAATYGGLVDLFDRLLIGRGEVAAA